jgi:hypothetical protein
MSMKKPGASKNLTISFSKKIKTYKKAICNNLFFFIKVNS